MTKRMSPSAIKAMNRKRYGKSGKKPTPEQLKNAFDRQAPESQKETHYPHPCLFCSMYPCQCE